MLSTQRETVTPREAPPKRHWRDDKGMATLEQLGVVVVVSMLVIAGTLGIANYGPHLSARLCELANGMGLSAGVCESVTGGGQSEAGADEPLQDEDFRPPACTLQTNSKQRSEELKVWFVKVGHNASFAVSESSDGSVTATLTGGGSAGVEAGKDFYVGEDYIDGVALGLEVKVAADVSYTVGDTWEFESMEEWEAHEAQLDAYVLDQRTFARPGSFIAPLFRDLAEPPKAATISTQNFKLEGSGATQGGFRSSDGEDKAGEPNWYDPNLGAHASAKLSGDVTLTTNHETNETAETFTFATSGEAGLDIGTIEMDGAAEYQSAFKVTRNGEGQITNVEFTRETSTSSGVELGLDSGTLSASDKKLSGSVDSTTKRLTVITTELDVTDANRDSIDEWFGSNMDAAVAGQPIQFPSNMYAPTKPVEDDPFAQLLYEEARSSKQVYDNVDTDMSVAGKFKWRKALGISLNPSESSSILDESDFLGAPGSDGERRYLKDETCVR